MAPEEKVTTWTTSYDDLPSRQRRRLILTSTLRTLANLAVLVALYYLLPFAHRTESATLAELVIGVLVIALVVYGQTRTIIRSPHPNGRAIEALAFTVPLYLLLFATTYFLMDRALSSSFTAPLTRTDALYFSVTVFTTVGFGDISAKSEAARLVVTCQMLLDLVVLGLVVRLFLQAVKLSQRQSEIKA
jgi:voltage-gated potassium channel